MSRLARDEFRAAQFDQTTQNDARRIYQRVLAAQKNPGSAGIRWPFELIQNAHDAGPRKDNAKVEVYFQLSDDCLVVSHTGKPFVAHELAALLSGGSSKEFDSDETTGRFGTGFLVTHAVSPNVDIEGILTTQQGTELFRVKLERGGDEASIISNIEQASNSMEEANSAEDCCLTNHPTVTFHYQNPNNNVVRRGLDRLEETLPYLYATCRNLGRVHIERSGKVTSYEPLALHTTDKGDFVIHETKVGIGTDSEPRSITSVRIGRKGARSALLTVLSHSSTDGPTVSSPSDGLARIFVRFPISGTDLLPLSVIVDGDFSAFQERDGISMDSSDRKSIGDALSAFPILVQHAVSSGRHDAHELACIGVPPRPLSGDAESGELDWWKSTVMQTALQTASRPLVKTRMGFLPALCNEDHQFASFPVPAIDCEAPVSLAFHMFYDLVSHIKEITLPSSDVAESWGHIARQWQTVGVPLDRVGLSELTKRIKADTKLVADLPIDGDAYLWIAQMLRLAAGMKDQNVRSLVNGLLPNQNGMFCNTERDYLYQDDSISAEVKHIATKLGEDIRSQLLDNAMAKALLAPGYEAANQLARSLLDDIDGGDYTESRAIDLILSKLADVLPNDLHYNDGMKLDALEASAQIIVYLQQFGDPQSLRQCPLLTAAHRIAYLTGTQQILAPTPFWPETARPYFDLYAPNRILSEHYSTKQVLSDAITALIKARLVLPAPLYKGRRAELTDLNLLREMSPDEQDIRDVTVRDANFGQIAFLSTDLVQRCGESRELAKRLLDFVLNVAAREDQSWRQVGGFCGNRSGEQITLRLNEAVWPFELKIRSWIPVQVPDTDAIAPMPANESNLRELIDKPWLTDNREAIDLLHYVFGFRQLTLMLDNLGADIEHELVALLQQPKLIKAAVESPESVEFASELIEAGISLDSVREFVRDAVDDDDLLEHLAKRREQRHRVHLNQNLGNTIEHLVREQLEEAGFSVRRTGVGSDFEISAAIGHLADLHIARENESWLVEVKATQEQRVRMTAAQARKAVEEGDRFLLCVVPVDSEDVNADLPRMRFVSGLGERLANHCDNLGALEGIRDDITAESVSGVQLEISPGPARVRVFSSVWEGDGFPLDDLAARLMQ